MSAKGIATLERAVNIFCKTILLSGLIAGSVALPVQAADEPGDKYVSVLISGIVADDDRSVKDGFGGGELTIGRIFHEHWNIEGTFGFLDLTGENGAPDQDQKYLNVNALNLYNRNGRFQPYLLGGIGYVQTTAFNVDDENNFQANLGGGALIPVFNDRARFRAEILYRWESADNSLADWIFNLGVVFPFGKKAEPVAPPAIVPVVVVDSDEDGVPDAIDRCPGTPTNMLVDQYGCILDSDEDGIADTLDQCPDTPPNTKVDNVGCSFPVVIDLPDVSFRTNSDMLLDGANTTLNKAAQTLIDNPGLIVEVAGHTDSDGDEIYNLQLSQRRAEAVRVYLLEAGARPEQVSARGYGEYKPVADNLSAEGRAANRRVELLVLED
jgi:OOP family OmpA-OmpF porin